MEAARPVEKRLGEDDKVGGAAQSGAPNATDRPPLLPLNADLGVDGERRGRDAADEKDRRLREVEDRERQSREQRAGLLPLQVLYSPMLTEKESCRDDMKMLCASA
jgi:hypothetical protein